MTDSKAVLQKQTKKLRKADQLSTSLLAQLSSIKQAFVKVVLAVNMLVCSKKYSRELTGISNALATGISMFTDSFFKKIGEFDTINKCEIDDEIHENMNHFITPERTTDYYQR